MNIPEVKILWFRIIPKALLLKDVNHKKYVDIFVKPSEKYKNLLNNPFVLLKTDFFSPDCQAPSKFGSYSLK